MIRSAIIVLITIGSTVAQDLPSIPSQNVHDKVDKLFAKWDSTSSPGCALSVVRDGQVVYKHGYGTADLDHDIPIDPKCGDRGHQKSWRYHLWHLR